MTIIIGMIVALGALSSVMSRGVGSTRGVSINNVVTQIVSQANLIRAQVMTCANGNPASGQTGDNGTGVNITFPYTGAAAQVKQGGSPVGTDGAVSSLYCPRTLSGSTWVVGASDPNLWSGLNGVFLPQPPAGFAAWRFTSTANVVKISTSYIGTNAESAAALTLAAARFSSAEVSIATANTLVICLIVSTGTCS